MLIFFYKHAGSYVDNYRKTIAPLVFIWYYYYVLFCGKLIAVNFYSQAVDIFVDSHSQFLYYFFHRIVDIVYKSC